MRIPKPWYRRSTDSWYLEINGRQIRLGSDKKEADAKYREIVRARGLTDLGAECSAHDMLAAFWDWYKRNRKPTTVETRHRLLQSFIDHLPASLPADAIRPYHVQNWLNISNGTSPSTTNTRISFLSSAFNWGRKFGYIKSNPLRDMPKPTPRTRQEFVPPDQFRRLIKLAPPGLRSFVRFMLVTGARPQEMFKLTADTFNEAEKNFTLLIEDSKGNKRSRVIQCPPDAMRIAKALVRRNPTGLIFRNSRGTPWNKNNVNCAMRRLADRMGLDSLCATQLRHSYCHYLLTKGWDVGTVAKLMGHADTRMIMTRYGHLDGSKYLAEKAAEITLPRSRTDE
jgi:integrase